MFLLSHLFMTTRKTIALTIWTFAGKVMSLLFNTLSRFVISFLPRSKHLIILWLQSAYAMILESKKRKSVSAFLLSLSICHEVMGLYALILAFWILSFKSAFSLSSEGSSVLPHFLPLQRYHLYIWGCWYFSWQSWFQLMIHPVWHFTECTLHIH